MSIRNNATISKKLNAGIKLFGDDWTLYIITTLENDEMRYCEIERSLPKINPATLANRLKKLEKEKLIQRREETLNKLSVTYALTQKGRAALPILIKLKQYADRFL